MKLSPSQRLMRDSGAPAALFIPQDRRTAAWAGRPLTTIPAFDLKTRDDSPETVAFRAQVEADRRLKSLAGIAKMKNRFAAKAADYSKVRWDPRKCKFVPIDISVLVAEPLTEPTIHGGGLDRPNREFKSPDGGQPILTKDNAEAIAKLNGVWKDSYDKLRGTGRIVMTVGNVLKGIAKRGGTVKWQ